MSVFSELLSASIKQSGFTLPQISLQSNISTALIYKLRTGDRLPRSEEQLKSLLSALCLTPAQTDRLLEEYRIEKLGRERYRCFMNVKDILENPAFSYPDSPKFRISFSVQQELSKSDFKSVYKGEDQLNSLVLFLIDRECRQSCPAFSMILSTDYLFLNKYLSNSCASCREEEPHISQVINLLPASDINSGYENIRQLKNMIPMLGSCRNYEPHYLYGMDNACQPYPYFLLTSEYLLLLSADFKTGILHRELSVLSEYRSSFARIWDLSFPFISKFTSELAFLDYFTSEQYLKGSVLTHMLSSQPCLPPFVPPEIGLRHLSPEMAGSSEIQAFLQRYFLSPKPKGCNIFTLDGLDRFLREGKMLELPSGSYLPFTRREAQKILQSFLSALEGGEKTGLLIKTDSFSISPCIMCYAYENGDFSLMWQSFDKPDSYFWLQEKTTSGLFIDFIKYIASNRTYTYSMEETLVMLKKWLE